MKLRNRMGRTWSDTTKESYSIRGFFSILPSKKYQAKRRRIKCKLWLLLSYACIINIIIIVVVDAKFWNQLTYQILYFYLRVYVFPVDRTRKMIAWSLCKYKRCLYKNRLLHLFSFFLSLFFLLIAVFTIDFAKNITRHSIISNLKIASAYLLIPEKWSFNCALRFDFIWCNMFRVEITRSLKWFGARFSSIISIPRIKILLFWAQNTIFLLFWTSLNDVVE